MMNCGFSYVICTLQMWWSTSRENTLVCFCWYSRLLRVLALSRNSWFAYTLMSVRRQLNQSSEIKNPPVVIWVFTLRYSEHCTSGGALLIACAVLLPGRLRLEATGQSYRQSKSSSCLWKSLREISCVLVGVDLLLLFRLWGQGI